LLRTAEPCMPLPGMIVQSLNLPVLHPMEALV
jgi:hypothetical protein